MRMEALRSDALARRVLAAVVSVDLISFVLFLDDARARALAEGVTPTTFAELLSGSAASTSIIAIGVAGAALFGWRAGRLWAGLLSLGALALLNTAHAELFGSPWRHLYYSGLCLSGWLLGLVVSRWRGTPADESYARIGGTALLGAAYLNGGISKLVFGGVHWAFGLPIQAIVVAQDGMVADNVVSAYRSWIVTTPVVAGLFASATMLLELMAPLMIVGRAIGVVVALGLLAMHLNILILTHILYWEAMVFLVLFGLLPRAPAPAATPEAAPAILFRGRSFVVTTGLLIACGLIGIQHQSRRFASWYQVGATAESSSKVLEPSASNVADARPARSDEATHAVEEPRPDSSAGLQRVGPFAVGQTLITGWRLDALELTDGGFVAMVSGEPGRARFEVTCSPSPHRSPFDLGTAHIFYSQHVAFDDLEAVGWALRRRLQDVGEGQELCGRLEEWRTAARAERRH